MIRQIKGAWWIDVWIGPRRYRKKAPNNSREGALSFEYQFRKTAGRLATLPDEVKPLLEEGVIRYSAFVEVWFRVYAHARLELSTREGYASIIRCRLLPYFGEFPLAQVDEAAVDGFISQQRSRGIAAKTINNALATLSRSLRSAKRWHLVENVPEIQMLKVRRAQVDYLISAESRQLLEAAQGTRWWLFILCALRTGMRASELLALRWEAVDLKTRTLFVRRARFHGVEKDPKSDSGARPLPITEDLWQALQAVPRPQGYVFTGLDGKPLTWDAAYRGLRSVCDRAGMRRIGLHVLRHSFGSQLKLGGVDLLLIKMLMGHSDIKVTQQYLHLPDAALRLSMQTLVNAHANPVTWHQSGINYDYAALPSPDSQRLESAKDTTKTPALE